MHHAAAESSQEVCTVQLPKRLARRLMDLQFLPYIVVTNPHIKKVYDSYHHAFDTLHKMPSVQTIEQNADFTTLLKRLVDEHGRPILAQPAVLVTSGIVHSSTLHTQAFVHNVVVDSELGSAT